MSTLRPDTEPLARDFERDAALVRVLLLVSPT